VEGAKILNESNLSNVFWITISVDKIKSFQRLRSSYDLPGVKLISKDW
jgi:hypothetical protein